MGDLKINMQQRCNIMFLIQKVTTRYIEDEDRIQLLCTSNTSKPLIIWLSRRLLSRLIPYLLEKINAGNISDLESRTMQDFAQHAVQSNTSKIKPVIADSKSDSWLATSIDINENQAKLNITFKNKNEVAILSLEIVKLRQWLEAIHQSYIKADWDKEIWPDWFLVHPPSAMLLH